METNIKLKFQIYSEWNEASLQDEKYNHKDNYSNESKNGQGESLRNETEIEGYY
jgi:hypothetical protein